MVNQTTAPLPGVVALEFDARGKLQLSKDWIAAYRTLNKGESK